MLHGVCFKVKSVGKPDAVAPHVRFDERGWETGLYATAPILDSTITAIQKLPAPVMDGRYQPYTGKVNNLSQQYIVVT
jgi:hypothetical protein